MVEHELTAAGLWEAVIMHPMTLPSSFLERSAARIPVRKMTESRRSALETQENGHNDQTREKSTNTFILVGGCGKMDMKEQRRA